MVAAYKRMAIPGQRKEDTSARDKRRMTRLLVSMGLFLLVFLGRGAFPGLCRSWSDLITTDVDLTGVIQRFSDDINGESGIFDALSRFAAAAFGSEVKTTPEPAVPSGEPVGIPVEVTLMSQSEGRGFTYLLEHGLRDYSARPPITVTDAKEPVEPAPVPQVVTAVAQAYSAQGEKLPRNVSYERYEFGLKKTVDPVMGTVTSGFGYRSSPLTGKREFHLALDIAAAEGTQIAAFSDGIVRYIGESDDFGQYLMIDHDNGVATFYAHCSKLLVRKGETVSCGQTVALVGHTGNATGSHLHFTIEKDNIRLDPAYYVQPT